MATSQRSLDLDIVTLRRIYVREASNAIISSNYALLSDGKGGTYWSTVVTSNSGSGGISGAYISTFSTSIGTSFTTQTLTASNINAYTFTTSNFVITSATANNLRIPSLATCNIYIDGTWSQAANYQKLSSNLNYYLSNDDMGSYIFCSSPSNLTFVPPGVTPQTGNTNPYTGQQQGNFFVLKNLGSNNLTVATNSNTTYSVINYTTGTFFYVGQPQNFWTPM